MFVFFVTGLPGEPTNTLRRARYKRPSQTPRIFRETSVDMENHFAADFSARAFRFVSPASNWLPTIFSMFMNKPIARHKKLL